MYCAMGFGVVSLYLLSFGPVSRSYTTVTALGPVTTTVGNVTTTAFTRTIQYPGWVYFIYYPALLFRDWGPYEQYLQWWEARATR